MRRGLAKCGMQMLGPKDLKVESVRQHEDVFEQDGGLALPIPDIGQLSQVLGDVLALVVDVLAPHQLNQIILEKLRPQMLRVLPEHAAKG